MTKFSSLSKKAILLAIFVGFLMVGSSFLIAAFPQERNSGGVGASPFTPLSYKASFHESGLANGVTWKVNMIGTVASTNQYVNFTGLANSTYSFTVNTVSLPTYQYIPTPSSGTVFVSGKNVTVSVSFYNQTTSAPPPKGYDLNFTVTNFPSVMPGIAWTWYAQVTGVNVVYGPTVSAPPSTNNLLDYFTGLTNGTYSYILYPAYGTALSPSAGNVTISGKNTTVGTSVSILPAYTVEFLESGLPNTQKFSVSVVDAPTHGTLYSSTNTTYVSQHDYVDFSLINQTYSYTVTALKGYTATPSSGTETVSGSTLVIQIQFSTAKAAYPVTFVITNPPKNVPGTAWYWSSVINGTGYGPFFNATSSPIWLPHGNYSYLTYSYGIALSPLTGTFSVKNSGLTVYLKSIPGYQVSFEVPNIAPSSFPYPSFTVSATINYPGYGGETLAGSPFFSTGAVVTIPSLPNGTYSYTLASTNRFYTISPTSGTFTVNGGNVTIDLSASIQPSYSVEFEENGLVGTSGVTWGVVVDNGFFWNDTMKIPGGGLPNQATAPSAVIFDLPQGTYWVQAFVIDSAGDYHFMSPVQVSVGSGQNLYTIQFATASGSSSSSLNLTATDFYIIGGVVAAVIVVGAVVYLMRKKGGTPP